MFNTLPSNAVLTIVFCNLCLNHVFSDHICYVCQYCSNDPCVCHEGSEWNKDNPKFPCYINVYDVNQSCYSSAEGGCYYDHGDPLESINVVNREEYDKTLERLKKKYYLNDDLCTYSLKGEYDHPEFEKQRSRGRTSCAGGYDVWVLIQPEFAQPWPDHTPTYQ